MTMSINLIILQIIFKIWLLKLGHRVSVLCVTEGLNAGSHSPCGPVFTLCMFIVAESKLYREPTIIKVTPQVQEPSQHSRGSTSITWCARIRGTSPGCCWLILTHQLLELAQPCLRTMKVHFITRVCKAGFKMAAKVAPCQERSDKLNMSPLKLWWWEPLKLWWWESKCVIIWL